MRDVELEGPILGLTLTWGAASMDLNANGPQVVVKVGAGPGPPSGMIARKRL